LDLVREHSPPGAVVFDVGANIGGWCREVVHSWPRATIYAFEPAKDAFAELTEAASDSVRCINMALSDESGRTMLHSVPGMPELRSLVHRDLGSHGLKMSEYELVETGTIDEFCSERGIPSIDLLKIDAEGHELAILRGAAGMLRARRIAFIQFEFGGANIDSRTYLRDFVSLLTPDYKIMRVLRDGLVDVHYSEIEEIFVVSNYFASLISL